MGATPPFVQIVLVLVKFCFGIMRLSIRLHRRMEKRETYSSTNGIWLGAKEDEGKMLLRTGVL
jgi:hypothetical protein